MPDTQVSPEESAERPSEQGLLDYEGVAELLGTTSRHVRKLTDERKIASVKVGALVRYERSAVADYVARQRRPAV
jgi:excisionase family DNA binding protein